MLSETIYLYQFKSYINFKWNFWERDNNNKAAEKGKGRHNHLYYTITNPTISLIYGPWCYNTNYEYNIKNLPNLHKNIDTEVDKILSHVTSDSYNSQHEILS